MRLARVLAAALALAATVAAPAAAQVTRQVRSDSIQRARQLDSLRQAGRQPGDTLRGDTTRVGRGAGVPKMPTRQFPAGDSVLDELRKRRGFRATRYAADSVQLLADDKEIRLNGSGLIERDGSTLEADTVRYTETNCGLIATGSPRLFDPTGNMVGEGMRYDACNHAGIVEHARTDLVHGGGTWYLIGDMAVDNEEDRVYAAHATITSCDLTDPHYHFETKEVKWVNKRLMVSRPAVLYVSDVPIIWLPFVFQDTRRGRRSGILAPQVGINDIVRFNPGYNRHISNVGYYWALSDFADAQLSFDWYASRYYDFNGRIRYRWLNRFLAGGLAIQDMHENTGLKSRRISWSHEQQFSLDSRLTANLDYATSSRIISRNAVDPILAIGTIDSRLNYQRRFAFGTLSLGGSRSQSLDKPQVIATFPSVGFTPNPIPLSRAITWSPSFTLTNQLSQHAGSPVPIFPGSGLLDSLRSSSRSTSMNLGTPLRVGQWNINTSLAFTDSWNNTRQFETDTTSGAIITRFEHFESGLDWSTGIGLPVLLQGTWNFQPAISMVNTLSGRPFMIRNSYTRGQWVSQGKRFQFAVGIAPTFFGFFPGFGPVARVRHALSTSLAWSYAPAADVPLDFALAAADGKLTAAQQQQLTQPARQALSLGLSQIFEAKLKAPAAPTRSAPTRDSLSVTPDAATPPEGRKIKLLSIQSGSITYDFEQAKLPGRTGWATQTWANTISSDLVRGFNLSIAHDLWSGPVGYDTTHFAPTLTSVAFGFSLGAGSLNMFRRLLGFAPQRVVERPDSSALPRNPTDVGRDYSNAFQRGPLATQYSSTDRLTPSRGGGAFEARMNFSLQKTPSYLRGSSQSSPTNSQLSGTVQFSPTRHWTVSWQTAYNFTQGQFSDHVIRLDRDLHDWRATFAFVKSPNGNFLFNFNIALIAEPDLKFDYDQRNVK